MKGLARQFALAELYEAYQRSRQHARSLVQRQLSDVLDFLEKEEELFDQAARRIKGLSFPSFEDDT